jgi:membrane protease YdiL (CAAX protease family)
MFVFNALGLLVTKFDQSIVGLKWVQILASSGIFIVGTLINAYTVFKDWKQLLSVRKPQVWFLLMALFGVLTCTPFVNYITQLNEMMQLPDWMKPIEDWMRAKEDHNMKLTQDFLIVDTFGGFLLNLLAMAVVPAIGEELLFRGLIQKTIQNHTRNIHLAIWSSAILFSAIHLQFYGFFPRMIMGAIFGYFLVWSQSIFVPIICHFLNNATIVTVYYLMPDKVEEMENLGTQDLSLSIISLLLFLGICYHMRKKWKYDRQTQQSYSTPESKQ